MFQHSYFKLFSSFRKIRSKVPFIVFESDDWGSIRTSTVEAKDYLIKKYPASADNPYFLYDCLEQEDDLSLLFDILSKYKDKFGNCPVLTANCVGFNPDFENIKDNKFTAYFNEPFQTTFLNTKGCENSFKLEVEGLERGLFFPQFHAREHLHVKRWMQSLQHSAPWQEDAFRLQMISFLKASGRSPCVSQYMDAFNAGNESESLELAEICTLGLTAFEKVWGYSSKTMIAPCYFWDYNLEYAASVMQVSAFQGLRVQKCSKLTGDPLNYKKVYHAFGTQNRLKQRYLVRNCFFEPSTNLHKDWVSTCLNQISKALINDGYASISVHRINFMGGISKENRDRNLKLFEDLLKQIKKMSIPYKFGSSVDLLLANVN